jgi:hypothetical protein
LFVVSSVKAGRGLYSKRISLATFADGGPCKYRQDEPFFGSVTEQLLIPTLLGDNDSHHPITLQVITRIAPQLTPPYLFQTKPSPKKRYTLISPQVIEPPRENKAVELLNMKIRIIKEASACA